MSGNDPPARKAARAMTSATHEKSSPVESSAAVSIAQYSAPVVCLFHQAGGNRPYRCRCHYCVSPLRMSHRIPHSHSRSRPSCPHRHPGPGCRPLALIWPILTRAAMSSSPVSDVVPVVPVDLLSETNWFVPRSPQLLPVSTEVVDPGVVESPELCSDMSTITSHSNPRGHRYLWTVWTRWSPTPYDAPGSSFGYIPGCRPFGDT